MAFTDFFIERPVFATVVNIIIFLIGLTAIYSVEIREYPDIKRNTITIDTSYYGADADLIKGFITDPITKSLAGIDGVDYIYSTSQPGQSNITVQLKIGVDDNIAFNDVQASVNSVRSNLPSAAEDPIIEKAASGSNTASMYIAYRSKDMTPTQLNEYVNRYVIPRLMALPEVSQITSEGAADAAIRVRLKPEKMRMLGVSSNDVSNALQINNFLSASGFLKNHLTQVFSLATTSINQPEEFKQVFVKRTENGSTVLMGDIADINYGAENDENLVAFNGVPSVVLPIFNTPNSNVITVMARVKEALKTIEPTLPKQIEQVLVYDSTVSMQQSINEVVTTIFEASIIVIFVIFLFLGSVRATFIPIITIPLSLAGACIGIMLLGFSINILTLLALVLAIGLVVDDAIVVIENIQRYMEEGSKVLEAAKLGASSIIGAIIAMTITLAAVFTPLGFSTGITGALFKEFAFTLALSVVVSGIVSLILSPMMCSQILSEASLHGRLVVLINHFFEKVKKGYEGIIHFLLQQKIFVLLVPIIVLDALTIMFGMPALELVPQEYNGFVFAQGFGPSAASFNFMKHYTDLLDQKVKNIPGVEAYFSSPNMMGPTNSFTGLSLKPWQDRPNLNDRQVMLQLMKFSQEIPGVKYQVLMMPSLPMMKSMLNQIVIKSADSPEQIYQVAEKIRGEALKTGRFIFVDSDLKIDQNKYRIKLNRQKMRQLGVSAQDVGTTLSLMLSGGKLTQFSFDQRSYDVVPEAIFTSRIDLQSLKDYPIKLSGGSQAGGNVGTIPLSTIAEVASEPSTSSYPEFQQLNSATLSYLPVDVKDHGVLNIFYELGEKYMPKTMQFDYADQLRFTVDSGNETLFIFAGALLFIYLILSATFESFHDPIIIMMTIPLATLGAFIPMVIGWSSFNMYTEIALVTLMGLITKHGILIVDFANHLRSSSKDIEEAALKAAGLRLRPILMTTMAMVLGAVPLVTAEGPGAFSRFDLGILIVFGMSIGTLFSLFIIPILYAALHNFRKLIAYLGVLIGQAVVFSYVVSFITA